METLIILHLTINLLLPFQGTIENMREDINCMATNIYMEASGEPYSGKRAVGHVVVNRVDHKNDKLYGNDICSVVYKPYQFSWTNDNSKVTIRNKIDKQAWRDSVLASLQVMYLPVEVDNTNGSTMYYAHKKVTPFWRDSFKVSTVINNHTFMKER